MLARNFKIKLWIQHLIDEPLTFKSEMLQQHRTEVSADIYKINEEVWTIKFLHG